MSISCSERTSFAGIGLGSRRLAHRPLLRRRRRALKGATDGAYVSTITLEPSTPAAIEAYAGHRNALDLDPRRRSRAELFLSARVHQYELFGTRTAVPLVFERDRRRVHERRRHAARITLDMSTSIAARSSPFASATESLPPSTSPMSSKKAQSGLAWWTPNFALRNALQNESSALGTRSKKRPASSGETRLLVALKTSKFDSTLSRFGSRGPTEESAEFRPRRSSVSSISCRDQMIGPPAFAGTTMNTVRSLSTAAPLPRT